MKIRIFALAKELEMDSKVLIGYANEAGVAVKNSALASISPEEKEKVLQFIEENKEGEKKEETTSQTPATPKRGNLSDRLGKVKSIKAMAPRPHGGTAGSEEVEATGGDDGDIAVAVAEIAPEKEQIEETIDSEESTTPTEQSEAAISEVKDETVDETAKEPKVQGITREDYIAGAGSGMGGMREMVPRGTLPGKGRKSPKQATPNIAAVPEFKAPSTKKKKVEKEQAQKPDISFTQDMLKGQSPLSAHLNKVADDKKGSGSGKGGGRRGKSVGDLREEARHARSGETPRRTGRGRGNRGDQGNSRRRRPTRTRKKRTGPVEYTATATVELPMTIRSLSEAMGRPAKQIIGILFQQGEMVTINSPIEEDVAEEIAIELGVELLFKRGRNIEDELMATLGQDIEGATLVSRPPIITILGHVDHGKTTLLDTIRSANVASGEAGGITQHIASYQVEHNGHKLTFLDTPGHAAFGEMRSRGANVTDIIVLVVAADDGVMPQTVECISHAKAAGVPIIVALNKIDLPDINEQKVLQELAGQDILPSEWGGDVEIIRTSAETGQGVDDLLETILLTAELHEYAVDEKCPPVGICIEAFRDEGHGPIAWLMVQKGTLNIGDVVLCGTSVGRIRSMFNDRNEEIQTAPPSTPVKISGLDEVPGAGDHFFVMSSIEEARSIADERIHDGRTRSLSGRGRPRTLDDILAQAAGGVAQDLPLIIKADTPGSLEALRGEISKIDHPEVRVEFVHEGVGGVNESDIYLASTSGAIIIAFHVIPEDRALVLADKEGVDIRRFNIIYEVTETVKRALEGLLLPEKVEVVTGRALVLRVFSVSRFGSIAGCRVLNGTIDRNSRVHVIRDQTILNNYSIASIKREKDDAKEVREGFECGIRLDGFNDVKEGDLFEAYRIDEVKRTLET